MPLATAAATNDPALVPTYTSNSFTVRLTDSRSSARSAPISYTPPVNPPPPSTSAAFDRRGRRWAAFFSVAVSSLTTLPIAASDSTEDHHGGTLLSAQPPHLSTARAVRKPGCPGCAVRWR